MSVNMNTLRQDVRKAPAELEREADRARDAVEDTLQALEQRLSPTGLINKVIDTFKTNGGDFGENLLTQVRTNPVPALMAGVGVAWLMMSSKSAARRSPGAWGEPLDGEHGSMDQDGGRGLSDRWSSAADSVRETAAETSNAARGAMSAAAGAARSAADTVKGAAGAATDAATRAASATKQAGQRVSQASQAGAQRVTDGYSYLTREQPLVLAALAVAAGAAIGALLPSTASENEWLGEASDEAKARLQSEAQSKAGDLQAVATSAIASAEDNLQSAMGTDGAGQSEADVESPETMVESMKSPASEDADASMK